MSDRGAGIATVARRQLLAIVAIALALGASQSHGQQPAASPAPAAAPVSVPTPPAVDAVDDAAVPDLADELADVDAGGLGESLSSVPNFIGDGCAPGASTSRIPIGRLAVASLDMYMINSAGTLVGQQAEVYKFPDAINSVAAIQAAGITGIPPGANGPLATIGGPISLAVTNPAGGPGSLADPGSSFTDTVNGVFTDIYPGADGVTTYVPSASGFVDVSGSPTAQQYNSYAFYDYVVETTVPVPGANVGFVKLTENVSPLPRDRVYFNYSFFHNALIGDLRNDVNRFTPGVEKTFADGWTSIEVRTPFAATIASSQTIDPNDPCGLTNAQDVEFGNMSVIFKTVLALGTTWAWTGGMQVALPTADDVIVRAGPGGPTVVRVNNESVRLMPFTGFIWAPNETWFSQSLLQMDTAANGNPAYLANLGGQGLGYVGRLEYPTFMYLSFSTGYWAYKSNGTGLTGVSPIMEVHVNQALQQSDVIGGDNYRLGSQYGVVSLVNGLVGCNFEWGTRSTFTCAYVTPLGGGADRWFDGELRAFWNYRFGPQNRLTRVQF
jgi:hypothetical protein